MEYKLKDLVDFKPGYAFKTTQMGNEGINLIKIKSLKNNKVVFEDNDVKVKMNNTLKDYLICKDDILMALTGDPVNKGSYETWVGRTSRYTKEEIAYLNQRICKLLPNEKVINRWYLYYWLTQYDKTYEIASLCRGSANQANISHKDIGEMIIDLPSIDIQNRVATILKSLDDKIELNNQINDNLHDLAEQLFIEIYKNGSERTLGELLESVSTGSRPKGGAQSEGIPSVGAEKIEKFGVYDYSSEKYISEEFYEKLKKGKMKSGDVLLYKDGAYTGKVSMCLNGFPHKKSAVNEHVFILNTKDNWAQNYLYFTLYNKENKEMLERLAGSKAAQPGLNQVELKSLKIKICAKETIKNFESNVKPIMGNIANNSLENRKLAELRDTLLPKLMNGEIDLEKVKI